MTRFVITAFALSFVLPACSDSEPEAPPHKNRTDPHAERVIAAMPGDLKGVAAINLPRILESETMSLLLAPMFEDPAVRKILVEAESTCGISFFDDVTRVFMGFGGTGRVTFAFLGKFQPRHFAACTRALLEKNASDRVTFEKRDSGFGIVVSDPAMRIEVVEKAGVVMFDVPKISVDASGKRVFDPTPPRQGDRGSLANNKPVMDVVAQVDTQQMLWMVSSGEASQDFLTEPPTAMWLDANAEKGLDIEVGLRYTSLDAAQVGRDALDNMISTFLGSPAKALMRRINLAVAGPDTVLTARFDLEQTNQLAALLVTAIGG